MNSLFCRSVAGLMAFLLAAQPLLSAATSYERKVYVPQLVVTDPVQALPSPGSGAGVGTGSAPNSPAGLLAPSSASLNFADTALGAVTGTQTVSVLNVGAADVSLGVLSVSGDYRWNTTCGSTLISGQQCLVIVSFQPSALGARAGLVTVPNSAGADLTVRLTGTGVPPSNGGSSTGDVPVLSVSAATVTFASLDLGATQTLTVRLTNSGSRVLTFSQTPQLNASGSTAFSFPAGSGTNCSTDAGLAPGEYCDVNLQFTPTQQGVAWSSLSVLSNAGLGVTTVLMSGTGLRGWGSLTAASGSSTNFGAVTVGATATQTLSFTNTGNVSITGVVASLSTLQQVAIVPADTTCGTAGAPVSLAAGATCSVRVKFSPTSSYALDAAALQVDSSALNSPSTLALSGSSVAGSGAWSTTYLGNVVTAPSSAKTSFGTVTTGRTASRTLYLVNTSAQGPLVAGFALSGETGGTGQFKITSVSQAASSCGVTIAQGGQSTTACVGAVPSSSASASYTTLQVDVQYAPTALGTGTIVLTPTSPNGSTLPGGITLSGTGEFNPSGSWSSAYTAAIAPSTTLAYPLTDVGSSISQTYYLVNTGTNGQLASSFTLSGADTSQFKIVAVGNVALGSCGAGITAGLSTSTCIVGDITAGMNAGTTLRVDVVYQPTVQASTHHATLTATGALGTTVPSASIDLTGSSSAPVESWSTTTASTTPLAGSTYAFGSHSNGSATSTTLYLRNSNTRGYENVGFVLSNTSGSTMSITSVKMVSSTGALANCSSGGTLAANGLSTTANCVTQAAAVPSGNWHTAVTVNYAPSTTGVYAATLSVSNADGAAAPGSVLLTGSSAPPTYSVQTLNVGAYSTNFWSDGAYAQSCLQYNTGYSAYIGTGSTSAANGFYRIQPSGQPYQDVYCDMGGGGWTLVASLANGSSFFNATVNNNGFMGISPVAPSAAASKVSDAFWAALPGTVTRINLTSVSKTFYVKYGSAVWRDQLWNKNGGNTAPSCSLDAVTWVTGRTYHVADCYNLSGTPIGFMSGAGYSGMGSYGGVTGSAWVR